MPDNSFMEMKYLEHGEHPENSTTHDDSKFRPLVSKICKIKGWYNTIDNDYCLGLQATYDIYQTPHKFIGELAKGKTKVKFDLGEDEYVLGIYGRGGEIINTLTFVTSSGRELKIGSSETGGNPFKIELPGHRIHTLVYGVGDYLTFVGAYFVPHSTSPKLLGSNIEKEIPVHGKQELMLEGFPQALYEEQGKYHELTVVVDHLKGICEGGGRLHEKITHIRAFENTWYGNQILPLGFEIFYDNQSGGAYFGGYISESRCKNFVLGNTEYLKEIRGRFITAMRGLVFITSLGREFKVGESISSDWEGITFSIKQGTTVIRDITWGMGRGNVHIIGAHFQLPPPQSYMGPAQGNPIPVPTLEYKGVGKTNEDTIIIDHLNTTGDNFNKITRIRGWQSINNQYSLGLEIFYDEQSGGMFCGEDESEKQIVEYNLDKDEYITNISGGSGDVLHRVEFHTNMGKELYVGENPGGTYFNLSVPGGHVRDIAFGYGGYLHNIGAHLQLPPPQPYTMTEKNNEDDKSMPELLKKEKQMKEFKANMSEERKNKSKLNYSINIQICI